MKRSLTLLLVAVIFAVTVTFAVVNFVTVPFHYLFGEHEIPLSVLMISAFLLGIFAGIMLDALILYRQRARIRRLEKKIGAAETELSNLRKMPLKDYSE